MSHGAHPKIWATLLEKIKMLEDLTATVNDIAQKLQQPAVIKDYT